MVGERRSGEEDAREDWIGLLSEREDQRGVDGFWGSLSELVDGEDIADVVVKDWQTFGM